MDLLERMRSFVAVVEAGSFTAGAARLGVSVKITSRHVAELERALGSRLLNRTTRSLGLTAVGVRYLDGARDVLERVETLTDELTESESALRGTLRVAAPVTYGEMHVAPSLARLGKAHPELRIELRLNDRYVDLAEEGFDAAVRIGRLVDSSLVGRRLESTALWTVASPQYLETAPLPKAPEELRAHRCVRDLNFRSGTSWPYLVDGQRRSVPIAGGLSVNSARAVRDLVLAGHGVGLCPAYVVERDVREKRLRRLLVKHEPDGLDVFVVYPSGRRLAPKVRTLVDHLIAERAARGGRRRRGSTGA